MFKFWGDINSQSPKSQPCNGGVCTNALTLFSAEVKLLLEELGFKYQHQFKPWHSAIYGASFENSFEQKRFGYDTVLGQDQP